MAAMIVTGAGGKLGRLLRAVWGPGPVWLTRSEWDMLDGPVPAGLPAGATVLHLAGVTHGSAQPLQANVELVAPLLRMCRKTGARRLVFLSSSAVYAPGAMAREDDAPQPAGAYGCAKVKAEALVRAQAEVPVVILRPGNIAGADALLGPRRPGVITLDPVPGQEGGPIRSWIGVQTFVGVLAALCRLDDPPLVLNVAQPGPLPMADLLRAAGLPWRYGPNPAALPVATQDTGLLQSLLPLPAATPRQLAEEAAWARGVLA